MLTVCASSVEYENREQEAYYTDEGRVNLTPTYYNRHEYTLKDHLGNGRYWFCDWAEESTFAPQNLQTANYYAYGLPYAVPSSSPPTERNNKYQYNQKELNEDFGLWWNDYGARWQDPQLGRWHSIDPLAEKYYAWSGYNYVAGNPIRLVDPDGQEIRVYYGE